MRIFKEGNIRIDLLGGTLDLWPINLIIPQVVTLNMASNLKVKVTLEKIVGDNLVIESQDYQKTYTFKKSELSQKSLYQEKRFREMNFICQLLDGVGVKSGVKLSLQSESPPGAGLGGSSVMGVTLTRALNEFLQLGWSDQKILHYTQAVEARILDAGPSGYQDYYPAFHGGILAILPIHDEIQVEQLFNPPLKEWIESHLTLVYSTEGRQSGINNWEVYKRFFDGDKAIRGGLEKIAKLSWKAYKAIKKNNFSELLTLISQEGQSRMELFPGIVPGNVKKLVDSLDSLMGFKMCGAGGGGCFLLIHKPDARPSVIQKVMDFGMIILDYEVSPPIS